jgi:hypothetical protein
MVVARKMPTRIRILTAIHAVEMALSKQARSATAIARRHATIAMNAPSTNK